MANIKHLFECVYFNPMKVVSQYIAVTGQFDLAGKTMQIQVPDLATAHTGEVAYYLLIYAKLPSIGLTALML